MFVYYYYYYFLNGYFYIIRAIRKEIIISMILLFFCKLFLNFFAKNGFDEKPFLSIKVSQTMCDKNRDIE